MQVHNRTGFYCSLRCKIFSSNNNYNSILVISQSQLWLLITLLGQQCRLCCPLHNCVVFHSHLVQLQIIEPVRWKRLTLNCTSSSSDWGHFAWSRQLCWISLQQPCRNKKVGPKPNFNIQVDALRDTVNTCELCVFLQISTFLIMIWVTWRQSLSNVHKNFLCTFTKSHNRYQLHHTTRKRNVTWMASVKKRGQCLMFLLKICLSLVWIGLSGERSVRSWNSGGHRCLQSGKEPASVTLKPQDRQFKLVVTRLCIRQR